MTTQTTVDITTTSNTSTTGVINLHFSNGLSIHESYDVAGLTTFLGGFAWDILEDSFENVIYKTIVVDPNSTNDTLSVASGNAIIIGGFGNDIINGDSNATDILISRSTFNTVTTINAGSGKDLIFGGAGNDVINGSTKLGSTAIVFAGAGNNTININSESGLFFAEGGNDKVAYNAPNSLYTLVYADGGIGVDTLSINLTSAEYGLSWVKQALSGYNTQLLSANANTDNGSLFTFSSFDPHNIFGLSISGLLDLTVRNFESMDLYVNGVLTDITPHPMAKAFIDGNLNEDGGAANTAVAGTGENINVLSHVLKAPDAVLAVNLPSATSADGVALSVNPDGSIAYNPDAVVSTFSGMVDGVNKTFNVTTMDNIPASNGIKTDSFQYIVHDQLGNASTATATVNMTTINDAPIAFDDAYSNVQGKVDLNVLANDKDLDIADRSSLSVDAAKLATEAHSALGLALSVDPLNGQIVYDPSSLGLFQGVHATDTFTYLARDPHGADSVSPALVTVDVVGTVAPVVHQSAASITEDQTSTVSVDNILSISNIVQSQADGSISLNGTSFIFTPSDNLAPGSYSDTINFNVFNGALTIPESVTLTINAINDAPTVNAPASINYTAGNAAMNIAASIADTIDANEQVSAMTIQLNNAQDGNAESLNVTIPSALSSLISVTGNGTGTITLNATAGLDSVNDFNTILQSLTYQDTGNGGGPARTLTITANGEDAAGYGPSIASTTINVAQAFTLQAFSTTINNLFVGEQLSNFQATLLPISDNNPNAHLVISFLNPAVDGFALSAGGASGTELILNGKPFATGSYIANYSVQDIQDGQATTATISFNVTAAPPHISVDAMSTFIAGDASVGGTGAITIAPNGLISDGIPTEQMTGMTIQIENYLLPDNSMNFADTETLSTGSLTGTNINANYDSTTGVLTLTGNDSIHNYNTVLDGITFNDIGRFLGVDTGTSLTRTIDFTVTDAAGLQSNLAQSTITLDNPPTTANSNPGDPNIVLVTDQNTILNIPLMHTSGTGTATVVDGGILLGDRDIDPNDILTFDSFTQITSDKGAIVQDAQAVVGGSGGIGSGGVVGVGIGGGGPVTGGGTGVGVTIPLSQFRFTDPADLTKVITYNPATVISNVSGLVNGVFETVPITLFEYLSQGQSTTDSFTYTIHDSFGATASATVTVKINGVNDAPIAFDDNPNQTIINNQATTILSSSLLSNDHEFDQNGVLSGVSLPSFTSADGATLSIDANGNLVYDPSTSASISQLAIGTSMQDSFLYNAISTVGAATIASANPALVTFTVSAINPVLTGTSGNDTLIAAPGITKVLGLAGDDTLSSGTGHNVLLIGDSGNDTLMATPNDGTIAGYAKGIAEYSFLESPIYGGIAQPLAGGNISSAQDISDNMFVFEGKDAIQGISQFLFGEQNGLGGILYTAVDIATANNPGATADNEIVIGKDIVSADLGTINAAGGQIPFPLDLGGPAHSNVALIGEGGGSTLVAENGSSNVTLVPGPNFYTNPTLLLDNTGLNAGATAAFDHTIAHFSFSPLSFVETDSTGASFSYTGVTITDLVLSVYNEGTAQLGSLGSTFSMALQFAGNQFLSILQGINGSVDSQDNQILLAPSAAGASISAQNINDALIPGGFNANDTLIAGSTSQGAILIGGEGNTLEDNSANHSAIADYAYQLADYRFALGTGGHQTVTFLGPIGPSLNPDTLININHFNFDDVSYSGGVVYNGPATANNQIIVLNNIAGSYNISSLVHGFSNVAVTAADVSSTTTAVTLNATGVPQPVYLIGGDGNDTLIGNGQNDILNGRVGENTFVGAPGIDNFQFTTNNARGNIGTTDNINTINNFEPGIDKLVFGAPFLTQQSITGSSELLANSSGAPTQNLGNAMFIFDTQNHNLWYDTHTAQGIVEVAHIHGVANAAVNLTAADIVLH